jgi:NAD(P)-dependent dehydrogenase (short-subunit alcohol dehydrogenase family)
MGIPYSESPQGYESQWATNYMGHYLLTRLLLPTLLATAATSPKGSVRIVNVSSNGHELFPPKPGIDFEDVNLKNATAMTRYGQSKLANVLHAKEIAERYGDKNILAISLHPGGVNT